MRRDWLAPSGVVTASTGNHGQSVSCAAQIFGVRAVIVVPEGANAVKVAAMRAYCAGEWALPPGLTRKMLEEVRLGPVVRPLQQDAVGDINIGNALKEGGRTSSDGRDRHRARNALVVAQIALAMILLVGAGLMIRTFQALQSIQPGFVRPEEVLTLRIIVPGIAAPKEEESVRMHERIMQRLQHLPGVISVGLSSSITLDGNDSNDPIFVEDHPYAASQRFREIGIRIALGARQQDVSRLFVRHGLVLIAIGLAAGLGAAAALTRLMAAVLFGVNPLDPLTFVLVTAILGGTALLASYLPARRAARMDPVEALHWE